MRAMLAQIAAPKLTSAHIRAVDALLASENPSAEVSLPGGWTARRQYGLLTLIRRAKAPGWDAGAADGGRRDGASRARSAHFVQPDRMSGKNPQNQNSPSTFVCRCDMIDKIPELWARAESLGRTRFAAPAGGGRSSV